MKKPLGTLLVWVGMLLAVVSVVTTPAIFIGAPVSNEPVFWIVGILGIIAFTAGRVVLTAGRKLTQDSAAARLAQIVGNSYCCSVLSP